MANYNLSEGALEILMQGRSYNNPVTQILGIKSVTTRNGNRSWYRVLLSDGKHKCSYVSLTNNVQPVSIFSIVEITRYHLATFHDSKLGTCRVLGILEMKIIAYGEEVLWETIGSPIPLKGNRPPVTDVNKETDKLNQPGTSRQQL